jgi:hypothetical protein
MEDRHSSSSLNKKLDKTPVNQTISLDKEMYIDTEERGKPSNTHVEA